MIRTPRPLRPPTRHPLALLVLLVAALVLGACNQAIPPGPDQFASNGPVFDIATFEQNLREALDDTTVGYVYAINQGGLLYSMDGEGSARTAADSPSLAQSPTKRMNIASVAKTITAVAVLQLLEANGLSPDDSIVDWLPLHWDPGPNVATISFRDLLTHTSGLNGNQNQDYDYDDLRAYVEAGISLADKTPVYQNTNFAMFRMIIPYLWKGEFKLVDPSEEAYASGLAELYIEYVREHVLEPAGITGASCDQQDPEPTLLYAFPDDGDPGIENGDWTARCGSGGWYLSAYELAAFLAHLRHGDLLSDAMREQMDDGFLGWQQGWSEGHEHGTYRNHNGTLLYDGATKGMSSIVIDFPIEVQAAVMINSRNGDSFFLRNAVFQAFDDAWVAP